MHNDGNGMWFTTCWDIKLQRIHPYSDHFDLDYYDYYNPYKGNYEIGSYRGRFTIGELAEYVNSWDTF